MEDYGNSGGGGNNFEQDDLAVELRQGTHGFAPFGQEYVEWRVESAVAAPFRDGGMRRGKQHKDSPTSDASS